MSKHTPGPWVYDHIDGQHFELKTTQPGDYEPIITGCGCCGSPLLSKDADGRLIAAAPELLESLIAMVSIFSSIGHYWECMVEARAVIAKATGEQP